MNHPLPFCSVIIVNYNGKHLLHDCLTAVLSQAYDRFEVIVVDNGSSDGSAVYVEANFPGVTLVRSTGNTGFAGGNNEGVRHAAGELIVLLNNDAIVADGWLQGLVDAVAPAPVAIAGSLIRTEGVPEKYYEKNGSLNFLGHNIMRKFERPENTCFAGGASLIYKRDILGAPFDDEYFLYLEDVYLSLRARFLGCVVIQTSASRVRHLGSDTTRTQQASLMTMYQERNRLLTMLLFFSTGCAGYAPETPPVIRPERLCETCSLAPLPQILACGPSPCVPVASRASGEDCRETPGGARRSPLAGEGGHNLDDVGPYQRGVGARENHQRRCAHVFPPDRYSHT